MECFLLMYMLDSFFSTAGSGTGMLPRSKVFWAFAILLGGNLVAGIYAIFVCKSKGDAKVFFRETRILKENESLPIRMLSQNYKCSTIDSSSRINICLPAKAG